MTDFTISKATLSDLPACAAVIRAAFADDEYYRFTFPKHLRNPDITEASRVAKRLTSLVTEFENEETSHFVAKTSAGDVVGFGSFLHGAEITPVASAGSRKPRPADPERDDAFGQKMIGSYRQLKAEHCPSHTWAIQRITVDPTYHRQGIGSALVKAGMDEMRALDPSMRITLVASKKAEKVYERAGFVKMGETVHEEVKEDGEVETQRWPFMVFTPPAA